MPGPFPLPERRHIHIACTADVLIPILQSVPNSGPEGWRIAVVHGPPQFGHVKSLGEMGLRNNT